MTALKTLQFCSPCSSAVCSRTTSMFLVLSAESGVLHRAGVPSGPVLRYTRIRPEDAPTVRLPEYCPRFPHCHSICSGTRDSAL